MNQHVIGLLGLSRGKHVARLDARYPSSLVTCQSRFRACGVSSPDLPVHYITLRSLPTIQFRAATKPSLFSYDTLRSVTHPSTRRPSAFMMLYLVSLTSFNTILYPDNDFQTSIRNPKTSRWSSGAPFQISFA